MCVRKKDFNVSRTWYKSLNRMQPQKVFSLIVLRRKKSRNVQTKHYIMQMLLILGYNHKAWKQYLEIIDIYVYFYHWASINKLVEKIVFLVVEYEYGGENMYLLIKTSSSWCKCTLAFLICNAVVWKWYDFRSCLGFCQLPVPSK